MCTISWCTSQGKGVSPKLEIFFNRDESKERPRALLPEIHIDESQTRSVFPLDPQGGGTWISMNEHGLVLALLNYYQGRFPKGKLLSRGQIVKSASGCRSYEDVKEVVRSFKIEKYAPFSLLCFAPDLNDFAQVPLIRWDGRSLGFSEHSSPLISSLFNFEEVHASRKSQYQNAFVSAPTASQLYKFHRSHTPEPSAYSVCMHRDDAETVSLSHISVDDRKAVFNYYDGAPCKQLNPVSVVLERPSFLNNCAFA